MNILKKVFSAGAATLIDSVGGIIDKVHTSDEEKLKMQAQIDGQLQAFNLSMETAAMQFEGEVTARHAADMASDSWLSKNIRPLTLAFLIGSTVVLAYSTIFGDLSTEQREMVKPWIALLTTLDVTALVSYFGSRGMEKYKKISSK